MKMEIRLALWIKGIVTRHRFGGVFSLRMCRNGAKILAVLTMAMMLMSPLTAYAVGEGNLDGGGGSMGQGTLQNKWTPGMEGVSTGGSSEEYWSMGESLNQPSSVKDDCPMGCKLLL